MPMRQLIDGPGPDPRPLAALKSVGHQLIGGGPPQPGSRTGKTLSSSWATNASLSSGKPISISRVSRWQTLAWSRHQRAQPQFHPAQKDQSPAFRLGTRMQLMLSIRCPRSLDSKRAAVLDSCPPERICDATVTHVR